MLRWWIVGALTVALVGCGTSGPPQVGSWTGEVEVAPANGQRDVAVASEVRVAYAFSEGALGEVDVAFTVAPAGQAAAAAVPGTWSRQGNALVFEPAVPLAHATRYEASVAGTVTDASGAISTGDVRWSFATEADPATGFALVDDAYRLVVGDDGAASVTVAVATVPGFEQAVDVTLDCDFGSVVLPAGVAPARLDVRPASFDGSAEDVVVALEDAHPWLRNGTYACVLEAAVAGGPSDRATIDVQVARAEGRVPALPRALRPPLDPDGAVREPATGRTR